MSKLSCKYHPHAVLIEDSHAGDMVCSMCGLVVADRVIDVGSEWRTFSNDANAKDMCRVGATENPLLSGSDLSTMISGTSLSDSRQVDEQGKPLYRNRRNLSSADRVLTGAFREIGQMAEDLNLPKNIAVSFHLLFENRYHVKIRAHCALVSRLLNLKMLLTNLVLHLFTEVCGVSRVSKKEIGKVFKKILKILETNVQSVTVEDFMSRFCGNLNLNIAVQRVANEVAKRALNFNLVAGRSPVSVAAAAIYMAAYALGHRKEKREIGEVAGCAEATITCTYRAMHARASELFPEDVRLAIQPQELPL
ncbi:Transcription initiation factor TFIIB [Fasciola gigantica]|uniref:Transcription initiation factor IIB n=1 Tax=Fasciola gigantica TaxID=46835 RepID=A0A504XMS8_FASGI|nr:Transcription initiation factor TFIIB [Fasciola gigantica]